MNKHIKRIFNVLFIIYCLALIYVLFLHNSNRAGFEIELFSDSHLQMVNLEPFKTINNYIKVLINGNINRDIPIRNLFVNFILFLPMGIMLPIISEKKFNKFYKFFPFMVLLVILVEFMQFITLMGSADIDDVILNTFGACIGYLMTKMRKENKNEK